MSMIKTSFTFTPFAAYTTPCSRHAHHQHPSKEYTLAISYQSRTASPYGEICLLHPSCCRALSQQDAWMIGHLHRCELSYGMATDVGQY
jgi:hypothetical protein